MILSCSCEHKVQDEVWGKGMRVHNPCHPKESIRRWRCTVCLNERYASATAELKKKEKANQSG